MTTGLREPETVTRYLRRRLHEQAGICPGIEPPDEWTWWQGVDGADVWQPETPPQHGNQASLDAHEEAEPVYVPIDEVDAGDDQPRVRGRKADALRHYERVRQQLAALLDNPILPVDPGEVGLERAEVVASQLCGAHGSVGRALEEQAELNLRARRDRDQRRTEQQARVRKAEARR